LAGGAIVLSLLDVFGVDAGFMGWILALVGAIIGAILVSRFKDWAIIILAAIVGALLVVRGTQMLLPSIQGAIASLIGLVLAGGAIAYHGGLLGKK
jgi:predicted MFS family arabinose efflux permease